MRNTTATVRLLLLCLACATPCGAAGPDWFLVWYDEFDLPDGAAPDPALWGYDIGTGPNDDGWGNNELEYYTDRRDNAVIEGGQLVIRARRESFATRQYTSARLVTRDLWQWTYGRFEVRARMPTGQGLWPAIWMLPTDWDYGGWAASGEIDLMELVGHQPGRAHGTIHFGGEWPRNTSRGASFDLPLGQTFADALHDFAFEWEPDTLRWWIDDTLYQARTSTEWWSDNDPGPRAPFDRRFHLLLNVAVGGNWPGPPDATTVFPQQMSVEYVRVYSRALSLLIAAAPTGPWQVEPNTTSPNRRPLSGAPGPLSHYRVDGYLDPAVCLLAVRTGTELELSFTAAACPTR